MKLFNHIQNIYFLGIGGIGMSALAQYFVLNNKRVAGYDRVSGNMTTKLEEMNIPINYKDDVEEILPEFQNKENTLVVYTAAIPQDLKLLSYFKGEGFEIQKRAKVLGDITKEIPTLAVAGTHGKTTTSAILAHLLYQNDVKLYAFLGGVLENYDANFMGAGKEACVVEADEYDRSFLHLHPNYACITSMDADHLDVYEDEKEMVSTFKKFAELLPEEQALIYKSGLLLNGQSIGFGAKDDYIIKNIHIKAGSYHFDLKTPSTEIKDFELSLPGRHNLMNAGMAISLALQFGLKAKEIQRGLKNFKGVKRRYTYHLKNKDYVLIEDYAHHPKELMAVHQATREMFPNKKIVAVFQPHLYSRTRDFAQDFAESLSLFDELALLPIHPAREKPIEGITSDNLLKLVAEMPKQVIQKRELPDFVSRKKKKVILLLGAGDIGKEVQPVKKALQNES